MTLTENAVDKNFDLFESYAIRNIFSLPDGFQPSHEAQVDYEENAEYLIDNDLEHMRKRILAEEFVGMKLEEELEKEQMQVSRLSEFLEKMTIDKLQETNVKISAFIGKVQSLKEIVNDTLDYSKKLLKPLGDLPETTVSKEYKVLIESGQAEQEKLKRELTSLHQIGTLDSLKRVKYFLDQCLNDNNVQHDM